MTFRFPLSFHHSAILRPLAGMAFAIFLAAAAPLPATQRPPLSAGRGICLLPVPNPQLPGHPVLAPSAFSGSNWQLVTGNWQLETASASLTPPQTISFPRMSATMDVHGEDGAFVHGLQAGQVTLLENGKPVPVAELQELRPGVELFVAINAGQSLAIRDSRGISRYDTISAALAGWAATDSGPDGTRYSLVTNGGPAVGGATSLDTRLAWLQAFQAYQPDLRNAAPSLESLARAIDLAGMPAEEAGVDRAILYVTPPVEQPAGELEALIGQAAGSGVRVFVWMAASPQAFASPGAQVLERLASETGGQFFPFSGAETLPDPQAYLEGLGSLYRLEYLTGIRTSGAHTLSARIGLGETTVTAPGVTFRLNVLPPNPIFLSPPLEVVRAFPESTPYMDIYEGGQPHVELLAPQSIPLQVIVEFPDGNVRPLAYTRLYVDDRLAYENTAEPFDRFEWDLGETTTGGTHRLRLEAGDTLGLSQSSLEMPVDVEVVIPPRDIWRELVESGMLLNGGAVLVTGAALAAVLAVATRRARSARLEDKRRRATTDIPLAVGLRQAEGRRDGSPPGTSPGGPGSSAHGESAGSPGGLREVTTGRGGWFRRSGSTSPAYLVRVDDDGSPLPQAAIPLARSEVIIGRDPGLATCLLDDPSVDGLHARLRLDATGRFLLADQGSIAGTWVNYAPISSGGTPLEHGDLIHFGRLAFRFQLGKPPPPPKPTISDWRVEGGE